MYSCEAEHSHELSFPQGAHFSNGKQSQNKAKNYTNFASDVLTKAHMPPSLCVG